MQIKLASILVENQDHALHFYTHILGFEKKADIPMGEFRWLTLSSPDGIEGVELVLELTHFPPARLYQKSLLEAGIPATAFITTDIYADYHRLKAQGVIFTGEPLRVGPIINAIFEDTCGNLILLVQPIA
ncbi:MAG: VOC family protein [Pseudomonadota bacterium]